LTCITIHVKYHPNRLRGYGAVGVENGPSLLLWLVAYTTARTMEQAVITLYLSVLTAIFHVNLVIQYQNGSILDFIGAKGDGGGGENWSNKTCHQQTNTQVFYRPDALPVTQPTTSKH